MRRCNFLMGMLQIHRFDMMITFEFKTSNSKMG